MAVASIALAVLWVAMQDAAVPPGEAVPAAEHGPADPAPPAEAIVHLLKDGRPRFELLDTDGVRHKASLLQIDGDRVVLESGRNVFTIPVDQLQRSNRRGDSPWDGALAGLSVGCGLWGLIEQEDPAAAYRWKSDNPDDWTVPDTIALLAFSTVVGYIVDVLHTGKHAVFVGPMPASTSKRHGSLTLDAMPTQAERQLRVGYRLTF